jgi:hypothetical protein
MLPEDYENLPKGALVTRLETALWEKWIARFGRAKVRELSQELDSGRSVGERSKALVRASNSDRLQELLLEGFRGFFHQAVYIRRIAASEGCAEDLKKLEPLKPQEPVLLDRLEQISGNEMRGLLTVIQNMEFLPTEEGPPISCKVPFPVVITHRDEILTVQVLIMQSTVETWGEILGQDLRRILTFVKTDAIHDQTLMFLLGAKIATGKYVNFSTPAIRLFKRSAVNTYSGTMEVGSVGQSRYDTVGGRGKKPLRESMPEEFQKLIQARRVVRAEVELTDTHLGLAARSKMILFPTTGKIAFRSNLGGKDPDDFIQAMAGT